MKGYGSKCSLADADKVKENGKALEHVFWLCLHGRTEGILSSMGIPPLQIAVNDREQFLQSFPNCSCLPGQCHCQPNSLQLHHTGSSPKFRLPAVPICGCSRRHWDLPGMDSHHKSAQGWVDESPWGQMGCLEDQRAGTTHDTPLDGALKQRKVLESSSCYRVPYPFSCWGLSISLVTPLCHLHLCSLELLWHFYPHIPHAVVLAHCSHDLVLANRETYWFSQVSPGSSCHWCENDSSFSPFSCLLFCSF